MKKFAAVLLLAALAVPALPSAARADDWDHDRHGDRHHDRDRDRHDRWRGDIHRFHDHDYDRWREGHWYHGRHGGRHGWWWTVGNSWYFYNRPVYPYPDPFVPSVVTPVVAAPAVAAPPIYSPVPTASYYYCRAPRGYYPYVTACARPWRAVPAY